MAEGDASLSSGELHTVFAIDGGYFAGPGGPDPGNEIFQALNN